MKDSGIYIITNTVNNKQYVGLDSNLPHRAYCHLNQHSKDCRLIHRAIKKHGRDNFTVEIIRYPNVPHQILCWFERSHIAERYTKAPNGYNLTDGGDGTFGMQHSAETRAKLSQARRGKKHTTETRAKISKANSNPSAVTLAKMSKAQSNRSAETREKFSKAKRGENNPSFGKSPSAETRAKISETLRRKSLEKRGQGTLF